MKQKNKVKRLEARISDYNANKGADNSGVRKPGSLKK